MSGLVLGTLVPDLGYYLRHSDLAAFAHTAHGILLFCLPVAFLLVILVRKFSSLLIAPLPAPHRSALRTLTLPCLWRVENSARMALALLVGSATHLAWDSFTHLNGAVVQLYSPLREVLFVVAGHPIPAYNLLQHASTLVGVTILVTHYLRWLGRINPARLCDDKPGLSGYMPLAITILVSALLGLMVALYNSTSGTQLPIMVVRSVIYTTGIFAASYILLGIYMSRRGV